MENSNKDGIDLNSQILDELIDCFSRDGVRLSGNYKLKWSILESIKRGSSCLEIKYSLLKRSISIKRWINRTQSEIVKTHIIIALENVFDTSIDRKTNVIITK